MSLREQSRNPQRAMAVHLLPTTRGTEQTSPEALAVAASCDQVERERERERDQIQRE